MGGLGFMVVLFACLLVCLFFSFKRGWGFRFLFSLSFSLFQEGGGGNGVGFWVVLGFSCFRALTGVLGVLLRVCSGRLVFLGVYLLGFVGCGRSAVLCFTVVVFVLLRVFVRG